VFITESEKMSFIPTVNKCTVCQKWVVFHGPPCTVWDVVHVRSFRIAHLGRARRVAIKQVVFIGPFAVTDKYTRHSVHVTQSYTGTTADNQLVPRQN